MDLSQNKYDEIFKYYQKGIYDKIDKIVAIGDIHGDIKAFKNSLKKAGVINQQDRWIGGKIHVVQVGDILDRKPRNEDSSDEDSEFLIISFILKLQIESYLNGGGFHPVIGNHEIMNILGIFDYVSHMGMRHFNNFHERKEYFKQGGDFCKYLACAWNPIIKINNCLFCHGGISKIISSKYKIREINEMMRSRLYTDKYSLYDVNFQNLFVNENSILWNRDYSNNEQENNKVLDDIKYVLGRYNCRYMIVGHTPYIEGVKIKYNGHIICIDTAMSEAFGKKRNKLERIHFIEIVKNKVLIK